VMANALSAGFLRREAPLVRVEVKGHLRRAVAAAWLELRTACSGRRRGRVGAVLTKPGCANTARTCPVDHGTGSRSQMLIEATSMVPW
jgi:hypothetical protein